MRNFRACILHQIVMVIKSRKRWAGHVAQTGGMRIAHNILVGKPEGKRPLGRSKHGWDSIRTGWEGVEWMRLRIEMSGALL